MAFSHRLQSSRFELKYLISEHRARAIRDFACGYLVPDEHAPDTPTRDYTVNSLYLDSRDLSLCRATMTGQRNRQKLRIRMYDNNPDSPVFFEIKRRDANVILKQRAAVRRDAVGRLLRGHGPRRSDLMEFSPDQFGALQRFCEMIGRLQATGQTFVFYRREAYESPNDNSARLTFDRQLRAAPFTGELKIPDMQGSLAPRLRGVVLELKFTNRFPKWMRQMVRIFSLDRRSLAKYVYCVEALKSHAAPRYFHYPHEVRA